MHILSRMMVFLALTLGAATASAAERAIIVLDGSGSMWGQIDGTAKISIAREVLGSVLSTIPADLELGLLAYGHREKGNCSDIELMIPPAPGSAASIVDTANAISPKGKTPLSQAVGQAAEILKYTEEKATVILITDGLETCNADPCALARQLETSGIDFTAHVVGFGLSAEEGRQVACLAEETGGKYIQADNAEALSDALTETVAEVVEPPPPPVEEPEEVAELPEASLDAPDTIEIGKPLTVTWDGPGERRDYIYLVDPAGNNGEGRNLRGLRVIHGDIDNRQVRMTAPVTPGAYELQYRYDNRDVIATRPIEVIDALVSLSAPANAEIGSTVTVEWVGPGGNRDAIELFDPAAKQGEGAVVRGSRLVHGDFENRTVSIVVPTEPGFYQFRYWNGEDRKVLASREIEVLEADVSVSGPESVDMGRTFEVSWVGPGANRDAIELYDPEGNNGNGKVVTSTRLVNGDFDARTVTLLAPVEPGDYQLRYWNGDSRAVLATSPIVVVATAVSVAGPESADMGRTFEVSWVGPGANRDAIELFDPEGNNGNGKVVVSQRVRNGDFDGRTVKLVAPNDPGDFQLRYWSGDGREVLATAPITVVATQVSISGPESVDMGRTFEVAWVGPGSNRDAIEIFDADASNGNGKAVHSMRLTNGDYDGQTVSLIAPIAAKTYELRYWDGNGRKVLASAPLVVVATEVTISAPDVVPAGEAFTVEWVGPGARRDSIDVMSGDAEDGKRVGSGRLTNGDYDGQTVKIKAPKEPGSYTLRYWNGDYGVMLATRPITVE
ncbi:vWA domain-containing protein [Bauldia litoralis]|uniref:Ca-activated chloride channel family protein n=1 Tax=Bauldia litoralis TaxID=665467 RepID=A0A1G6AFI4_9HYPH|nr:Ca-activated chloride channel family protein [Bauldia litoralis]